VITQTVIFFRPHYHTNPVADRAGPIRWLVDQARERANQNQFDILHFHTDVWSIEIVDKIFMENHTALLMTMHGLLRWDGIKINFLSECIKITFSMFVNFHKKIILNELPSLKLLNKN
jgi:hypothetical protein